MQELRAIKSAIAQHAAALPKAESVNGMELEAVRDVDEGAGKALMEVDDSIAFVGLYEQMQCEPDRAAAKALLIKRIHLYRPLLEAQVHQIGGALALADLPATKDAGQKLQDDLRAASAKLTAIEGSLK